MKSVFQLPPPPALCRTSLLPSHILATVPPIGAPHRYALPWPRQGPLCSAHCPHLPCKPPPAPTGCDHSRHQTLSTPVACSVQTTPGSWLDKLRQDLSVGLGEPSSSTQMLWDFRAVTIQGAKAPWTGPNRDGPKHPKQPGKYSRGPLGPAGSPLIPLALGALFSLAYLQNTLS